MDESLSHVIAMQRRAPTPDEPGVRRSFASLVEEISGALQKARALRTAGAYGTADLLLYAARDDLRQAIEELTHDRMWALVERLRAGAPLDADERDVLRLWLVGEADPPPEVEPQAERLAALARLEHDMTALGSAPITAATVSALSALLARAHAIVLGLSREAQRRERLERLQRCVDGTLPPAERDALAHVLIERLRATRG